MKFKSFANLVLGCAIVAGILLLASDEPIPVEADSGSVLGNFSVSAPFVPSAEFSESLRMHAAGGVLFIEKDEYFHSPGSVPPPTMTKEKDGSVVVHTWASRPRVQLFNTKCEFMRTLRFSIPKSVLKGASVLTLANHDTGSTEVLLGHDSLTRIVQEPEAVSTLAGWRNPLPDSGNGCGA